MSAAAKPFLLLTQTWFGVLGVRFADRVGKGLRNPPHDALLAASVDADRRGADVVDDKYRATAYGFYQAAVAVAILPASAGAGLLWNAMGPALPFAVGAVLALCAAMLLAVSGRQRS